MKQLNVNSLSISSLTAALYVTIVFFLTGITRWLGTFILPLSIIFGPPYAIGMGIGSFLSTFIVPRDPLVILSAVVGATSNFVASYACFFVYKKFKPKKEFWRMQIACLVAVLLTVFIDGTRTLIAWWFIGINWSIFQIWGLTFVFSFFSINIIGFWILTNVKKFLTKVEQRRISSL